MIEKARKFSSSPTPMNNLHREITQKYYWLISPIKKMKNVQRQTSFTVTYTFRPAIKLPTLASRMKSAYIKCPHEAKYLLSPLSLSSLRDKKRVHRHTARAASRSINIRAFISFPRIQSRVFSLLARVPYPRPLVCESVTKGPRAEFTRRAGTSQRVVAVGRMRARAESGQGSN